MAWSTAFEALMPDTVTVKTLSGLSTDGRGTPTYGTASTYTARVSRMQQLVRTFEGTEEVAHTVVWIKSTSTFAAASQITLPDGTTPNLLSLSAIPDQDGIHHLKAWFG